MPPALAGGIFLHGGNMLSDDDRAYLVSRGYTDEMIKAEKPCSLPAGRVRHNGIEMSTPGKNITLKLYSASNTFFGLHVMLRSGPVRYMNFLDESKPWLPAIYGTERDYDLIHQTGELILVEGVFDRAVFANLFPERACIARLSKGMTKKFEKFLRRFVRTLYVAYDMDEAGQKGWYSAKKRLHPDVWTSKIDYPATDPSELLKRLGEPACKKILEDRICGL